MFCYCYWWWEGEKSSLSSLCLLSSMFLLMRRWIILVVVTLSFFCVFVYDKHLIVIPTAIAVSSWAAAVARLFITIVVFHYGFAFCIVFVRRNIGQSIVTYTTIATVTATVTATAATAVAPAARSFIIVIFLLFDKAVDE